ncbi:MAG: hypothetical protein JKY08_09470 [Flavobacteriaceae bacterium]|nr:hypothetical protein [Flavobacteriaceae bacterium]
MNVIQEFKQAIDFAIFCAKPDEFVDTSNLSTNLYLCQQKFNNIQGGYNDKIDPRSKEKLDELKRKVKEKILSIEEKIGEAKRNEKRNLESRLSELREALKEIEVIINANTNYVFNIDTKPKFEYEDTTDTGIVNYDGTLGSLLNELKHAFQFETGKIDLIKIINSKGISENIPGMIYDLNDEVETYRRQYAFDGILKLRISLTEDEIFQQIKSGKIKSSLGIGGLEIKKMKKIIANIIVRVADSFMDNGLYKSISKKSLDIHSSIGDIKKGNKNRIDIFNSLGLNNEPKDNAYIDFIKVFIETKPFIYVKY